MSLAPGTRFGPYEITGSLGAGGMGEVYRARDTNLKRDVAIKVLPASLIGDSDRISRLQREAEVLASLNHPNIAQIYGLERVADGSGGDGGGDGELRSLSLIMELVEGPTLADRIAAGPLPADEALNIAMQIADALEAAHEKNVIHRDLKPANIKLRPDGTVKVLDFGIAKALAPEISGEQAQSPIMTTPVTQVGVILGTAAYMSPEQARGKPVDKRTDIWAFGCVLYEMLTGQLAFGGEDVAVILARIIANDTDLDSLPSMISPAVQRTLELCLQKDPRKRLRDIGDVKLALAGEFETGFHAAAAEGAPNKARPAWQHAVPVALAVAVTAGAFIWSPWAEPPETVERRLGIVAPIEMSLNDPFALSPDGRFLVVATSNAARDQGTGVRLWLWQLDTMTAEPLPGTEGGDRPFWSPDSRFIGFTAQGALKRIDVRGGPAQTILSAGAQRWGGIWTADDRIVFGNSENGFSRVAAAGGEPVVVTQTAAALHHELPALLPDGRYFLYFHHAPDESNGVFLAAIDAVPGDQPSEPLILADDGVEFVPDPDSGQGYILFMRQGTLLAQRFDPGRLELTGDPVPVAAGARGGNGNGFFAATADGSVLIYRPGTGTADVLGLVWVDADGNETVLDIPPGNFSGARVSPDATRVAVRADDDIWVWDERRNTTTRLTFTEGSDTAPLWSDDGTRIFYWSAEAQGIVSKASDGTGEPQRVVSGVFVPVSLTGDGLLIYESSDGDIGIVESDGSGEPEWLLDGPFVERYPALSPDGQWLAYMSDESGRPEIYVRPFPDVAAGRWQVSTNGGLEPKWSADGRTLFYRSVDSTALLAATIEEGSAFVASRPVQVLDIARYSTAGGGRLSRYDVAPDGRFLFRRNLSAPDSDRAPDPGDLIFVENWLAGVKSREVRD